MGNHLTNSTAARSSGGDKNRVKSKTIPVDTRPITLYLPFYNFFCQRKKYSTLSLKLVS